MDIFRKLTEVPEFMTLEERKSLNAFLRNNGFSAFRFARIYADGTAFTLSTEPGIQKYLFSTQNVLVADEFYLEKSFTYYIVPNGSRHEKVLSSYQDQFGIRTIVDVVKEYPDFTDVFALYTSFENGEIASRILNTRDKINDFLLNFSKKLNQQPSISRIKVPQIMLPRFQESPQTKDELDHYALNQVLENAIAGTSIKLSAREEQCVKLLLLNFSSKEIGEILNLSSRTVEFYLERIRAKAGIKYKSDFKTYFLKLNPALILGNSMKAS